MIEITQLKDQKSRILTQPSLMSQAAVTANASTEQNERDTSSMNFVSYEAFEFACFSTIGS